MSGFRGVAYADLFDIGRERRAIHWPFDRPRCNHGIRGEPGEEGLRFPGSEGRILRCFHFPRHLPFSVWAVSFQSHRAVCLPRRGVTRWRLMSFLYVKPSVPLPRGRPCGAGPARPVRGMQAPNGLPSPETASTAKPQPSRSNLPKCIAETAPEVLLAKVLT